MLNKEIKEKMMRDLNIPERRARQYTVLFADKFGGNVRAITEVSASYRKNGDVCVTFVIGDKRYHITVGGNKPFSKKNRKEEVS